MIINNSNDATNVLKKNLQETINLINCNKYLPMYMDIKLFAKIEKELKTQIKTTRLTNEDNIAKLWKL